VLDDEERWQRARRGQPGSWWYLVDADAAEEHAPVTIFSRHRSQQTARDALARAAKRTPAPGAASALVCVARVVVRLRAAAH
jgi:hypothetical protein